MNLQELKNKIREESPEYVEAIEKITKAAIEGKESYVDFNESEIPDTVLERLGEDGYRVQHNEHSNVLRVSGWAGDVGRP